jgi:hypothetical protein
MASPILKYFIYSHLPSNLQEISKLIAELAQNLDGPEKSVGLRKLLEAKDCFVRTLLP